MKKILLVDDFDVDLLLTRTALESHYTKFQVMVALDGEEAYCLLKEIDFDLMLLDVQMPRLDGFQLLERLHAEGLKIPPTIVVSGFGAVINRAQALALGAYDFIHKAIDFEVFKQDLVCAIDELGLTKTPPQPVDERRIIQRLPLINEPVEVPALT